MEIYSHPGNRLLPAQTRASAPTDKLCRIFYQKTQLWKQLCELKSGVVSAPDLSFIYFLFLY